VDSGRLAETEGSITFCANALGCSRTPNETRQTRLNMSEASDVINAVRHQNAVFDGILVVGASIDRQIAGLGDVVVSSILVMCQPWISLE
jgi:hypothetical protein